MMKIRLHLTNTIHLMAALTPDVVLDCSNILPIETEQATPEISVASYELNELQ